MSLISSSKLRHHTVIVSQDDVAVTGVMLERMWWNAQYAQIFDWRKAITRNEDVYHVCGNGYEISGAQAEKFVDAIRAGKIKTIDLRQYAMSEPLRTKGKGKK